MGTFVTDRQYAIPITASASTALAVSEIAASKGTRNVAQVELCPIGCDAVVNIGAAGVAASATPDGTTKKLPAGNIFVPDSASFVYTIDQNATHVSVISANGSTGTLWMKVGQGEQES